MKRILRSWIALAFAAGIATPASAVDGWVEIQVTPGSGATFTQGQALIFDSFTNELGWFAFGQRYFDDSGYQQAYAGPTWKPASWIETGFAIGVEKGGHARRVGYVLLIGEKTELFGIYEDGVVPWHRVYANYAITETLKIGVMMERFPRAAPRVEWKAGKSFPSQDTRLVVGDGKPTLTFVLRWNF